MSSASLPDLRRGDIVMVDFEPAKYHEANKVRPAIIITNNKANTYGHHVMVVPLTSNVSKVYPFQLYLAAEETGLSKDSKAQVELTRSISKWRIKQHLGSLPTTLSKALDTRLSLHLDL